MSGRDTGPGGAEIVCCRPTGVFWLLGVPRADVKVALFFKTESRRASGREEAQEIKPEFWEPGVPGVGLGCLIKDCP